MSGICRNEFAIAALTATCIGITGAIAQSINPPVQIDPQHYTLVMKTTLTGDGCNANNDLVWSPSPPVLTLQIGDTYTVEVDRLDERVPILDWAGTWQWKESRKCGKDTCEKIVTDNRTGVSTFDPSRTLQLAIKAGGVETAVTGDQIVSDVVTTPVDLSFVHGVAGFPRPDNPKPRSNANLVNELCATVKKPTLGVADVKITVLRRLR